MAEHQAYGGEDQATRAAREAMTGEPEAGCTSLIKGNVGVEASVKLEPRVEVGPALVQCHGGPSHGALPGGPSAVSGCNFLIHQTFSIEFPLRISAAAEVALTKTACEVPLPEQFPEQ